MQISSTYPEVTSTGIDVSQRFSIPMNAKLMEILSDLYTDARVAICRELIANMMDAVRTLPDAPPGEVILPDHMLQEIQFKDYGISMSHDVVMNVFAVYTASTKDQDNVNTGGWGLGGKSPFAYTDQWTLETRLNARLTIYIMHKDSHGISTCSKVGDTSTNERDGVTVRIPVADKDTPTFKRASRFYATYAPSNVRVLNAGHDLVSPVDYEIHNVNAQGFGWGIPTHDSCPPNGAGHPPPTQSWDWLSTIVLAGVPYELRDAANQLVAADLDPDLVQVLKAACHIFMPVGSLDVTPSRDTLQNTPESRSLLETSLGVVHTGMVAFLTKKAEACKTAYEFSRMISNETIASFIQIERDFDTGLTYTRDSLDLDGDTQSETFPLTAEARKNIVKTRLHGDNLTFRSFSPPTRYGVNSNWTEDRGAKISRQGTLLTYNPGSTTFYYNDLGPKAAARLAHMDPLVAKDRYGRSRYQTIWLIHWKDDVKSALDDAQRAHIARFLSCPLDKVLRVSDLDEPPTPTPTITSSYDATPSSDELTRWESTRVMTYMYDGPTYNFFRATIALDDVGVPKTPIGVSQRNPLLGGYYVPMSAFKVTDPDWPIDDHACDSFFYLVRNLLENMPVDSIPWNWRDRQHGLVIINKGFPWDSLDTTIWHPAIPIILAQLQRASRGLRVDYSIYHAMTEKVPGPFRHALLPENLPDDAPREMRVLATILKDYLEPPEIDQATAAQANDWLIEHHLGGTPSRVLAKTLRHAAARTTEVYAKGRYLLTRHGLTQEQIHRSLIVLSQSNPQSRRLTTP